MRTGNNKVLIIYITVVIMVVSAFGGFFYYRIKLTERYQLLRSYKEKADDDMRIVDNNISEIQRTLQYISKNPVVQRLLLGKYRDYLRANKDFSENVEPHFWYLTTRNGKMMDEIKLYAFNDIENEGYFIYSDNEAEQKNWYEKLKSEKKVIIYQNNKDMYLVYPIYQMNYSAVIGAIEVKLDMENITKHIEKKNSILGYRLCFEGGNILEDNANSKYREAKSESTVSDFELIYQIKDISMVKGSFPLLIIIGFCEFLIIFITLQYNKFLKKEHLEILEERKRSAYLENTVLKARISPHFLYNILSMINWKAKYSHQEDISEICLDLSEFYRTALNHGLDEISIKEELNNVESYIRLKQRLTEIPFTYDIKCGKALEEEKIINFILQPIVENALIHGIGGLDEGGHISIEVEDRDRDIYIKVTDNGNNDIDMEKIFANKKGYGLRNVNERIRLNYGKDYGVFVQKKEGKTEVVVKVLKF